VLLSVLIPSVLMVGLATLTVDPAARAADRGRRAEHPGPRGDVDRVHRAGHRAGLRPALRVIRRLAATALPRWLLVAGRLVAVLGVVLVQLVLLGLLALGLGWRPDRPAWAGRCCWCCWAAPRSARWGSCSAGRCARRSSSRWPTWCGSCCWSRGGIAVPLDRMPDRLAAVGAVLPSGALADGSARRRSPSARAAGAGRSWCCRPGRSGGMRAVRTVRLR
jgi:ABC-2 type transport system permease protein